jgi:hypothetical protein
MNEHIKTSHIGNQCISRDEFESLEMVVGTRSGRHKSYVEHFSDTNMNWDSGFRSESIFEARVGLLKSCFFHEGEEEKCVVNATFFCREKEKDAAKALLTTQVIAIFARYGSGRPMHQLYHHRLHRADHLCRQIGSTMVRHQLMRTGENTVSAKVFHPVTQTTAKRYATNVILIPRVIVMAGLVTMSILCPQVTEFVYFCSKASPLMSTGDSLSILLQVESVVNVLERKTLHTISDMSKL